MAGSRIYKIGNIFTRTSGLIKSGVIKEAEKPLWYDVYQAFPPKREPMFDQPVPEIKLKTIFYPEDSLRAKFYKKYGSPGIINLSEVSGRSSLCQLFVEKYIELENKGGFNEDQLMEEVEQSLAVDGIYLNKDNMPELQDQAPQPKELDLAQLFKLGLDEQSQSKQSLDRPTDIFTKKL